MAKKWVVENNRFVLGEVELHRNLSINPDEICCGGYWHINVLNSTIYLYGKSYDYGKCTEKIIRKVIIAGNYSQQLYDYHWVFSEGDKLDDVVSGGVLLN